MLWKEQIVAVFLLFPRRFIVVLFLVLTPSGLAIGLTFFVFRSFLTPQEGEEGR